MFFARIFEAVFGNRDYPIAPVRVRGFAKYDPRRAAFEAECE